MARWNYYFGACHAVSVAGPTVALPEGHGVVTLVEDAPCECVFFPAQQLDYRLIPGEIGRLERAGLAERVGSVR